MNDNTSMGNGASQQNHPNGQWQGQPGQQGQGQYGQYGQPQGGYQQGPPQGGWQQAPQPKKKNWFLRHKILTAILALFLIGGIASASGGGSKGSDSTSSSDNSSSDSAAKSDDKKSDEKKSEKKDEEKKDEGDKLPAVGTPVRDGKFEFTITKVERGKTTAGSNEFLQETAQGEYTYVYVTVKNIGDRAQMMSESDQKAFSSTGQQFSTDTSASLALDGDNNFFLTDINPGNQAKGILVFDAPKGTKLTQIELHDSFLSGGVKASL
jgi:hypothetical protein